MADGTLVEGTPLHAALHAIVACAGAGAAASSQSCGSGAAGAAASSLLTGLFSEASPNESEREREAKRNLIVSLVTGIAATTNLDAATANAAASGAVDNNWLATQQLVQARKELKEADGLLAEMKVLAKWGYISKKQDLLTQTGVGVGLVQAGFSDIQGLAQFLAHPIDGLNGLKALINDEDARSAFGDQVVNELNGKIDRMKLAMEQGGDEHALQLGRDLGELVWQVGGIATGAGALAKGGVKMASVGIKLGRGTLEKMAADGAELAKAEGSGVGAGKGNGARPVVGDSPRPGTQPTEQVAGGGKPAINGDHPQPKPEPTAKPAPAMDEFTVKAFNPYNSDKFKAMTPEQQKAFLKEYNKQLQAQQDAINRMTLDDFKSARDAYQEVGRHPEAMVAQQKFGKDFEALVRRNITESLMNKGMDIKSASAEAAVRAKQIRSDLAALHDPDMVAGGWGSFEPVRMGDSLVNSSIGGSWPSRLGALDDAVNAGIANGGGASKMNVRLELLRGGTQ